MSGWTDADVPDQSGVTVLVTGANSGLGLRSCEVLAAHGARVVLACRDPQRADTALASVRAASTGADPEAVALDLASLASVRDCAGEVLERVERIDVLINNAGVMAVPEARTVDGFERQIATNHLGPFALTGLLLPALLRAPQPRVVTVASLAHQLGRIALDHPRLERRRYSRWRAYGQTKLANLLFTSELQRRAIAAGTDLTAVAAHPGHTTTNLMSSGPAAGAPLLRPLLVRADRAFGQTAEMGALPQLYAATMPDVHGDDYWGPDGRGERRGHPTRVGRSARARDADVAHALWERSEALTGVTYPWPEANVAGPHP